MPSKSLSDLTSDTRQAAEMLLQYAADEGIELVVTHTLRTCDEQNALYAQGRTAPGSKLTGAPSCRSWHTHGRALDIIVTEDGKLVHNGYDERYARLGAYAKTLGFRWGGDFGDYGHFEYHPGITIGQVCPDPNACGIIPATAEPPRPGASIPTLTAGIAVTALALGAVAYMFADIQWQLTDRLIEKIDEAIG